ncbi:class I SAM-dependent methyltransferase [Acrocarpospora catenulata]|uniref:class I SAM-dependent methyltransferase n=1 Tax=Acrocarpospora catenulata TaxID=2836182 RepID=UPI001BDAFF15|nr:class I SAM-dependent methyltransferase [Acrocarpospora catenulata]
MTTVQDQASTLLAQLAGYAGHRTIAIGIRQGLIAALAEIPSGLTTEKLAERLGMDPYYVATWCQAAYAAKVCDRYADTYWLEPYMATLLLDTTSPAYVGGVFTVMEQDEMFGRFERVLRTGERLWWDGCRPEFIDGVAGTGTPFYTRLIPGGLDQIPGLAERLAAGCRVLETACGSGRGLVRLARAYPECRLTGVDGDAHSIESAAALLDAQGVRAELITSSLETMEPGDGYTMVLNNISMHECRDIDEVARRSLAALEPGGWMVISDFPFPAADEGLREVPGRIMSGIQFFEAQIGDQLLPREAYDELLERHGFTELGWFRITPMHAVTYGRKP